jgi:hypothetical protein
MGIGELENGAHIGKRNVQVDVDVGTAGYRISRLSQRVSKIGQRRALE